MNPHHPGHTSAYPHHPSLSSSPHHPGPGGPHHGGYTTGNSSGGGSGGGSGSTSTPDLPSPHSPPSHSGQTDPGTPYGSLGGTPGMGTNGHHHGGGGMMGDNPHHPVHTHPHLPGHPAYPPVNHNNNCTLKQEGGQQGSTNFHTCAGCTGRITERYFLMALERYWHNNCFKCSYCHHPLGDLGSSCFTKQGMILCKNDYQRMYGNTAQCAGCQQTIPPDQLVTRAGGGVFHVKCFCCSKCGEPLLSGAKYCLMSGQPVCETDWHKIIKASSVASSGGVPTIAGNGGAPQRKNKVGRPRRSRE